MIRRLMGSSGAAVASARLFSLVGAAVQLPLLTRLLDPSVFGLVAIAIAVATYFSLITAEPTTLSFQRFPGSTTDRRTYRYTFIRVASYVAALSVALGVLGLLTGNLLFLIAVAGWGTGIAANRLFSTAWLMWHEPWRYSGNLIATTAVRTAMLLLLVAIGTEPMLAVAGAGLATALTALLLAPRIRKRTGAGSWEVPWTWRFSLNLALASVAVTVLTNSILLILPLFIPAGEVGRFAATSQVVAYTSAAAIGLVITVAYPAFRRDWDAGDREQVRLDIDALVNAVLLIASVGLFLLSVGGHVLLGAIIGPEFAHPQVLPALIFGSAFLSMGLLSSWMRQFRMHAGGVNLRSWIAAAVGVGFVVTGTLLLGSRGAAIFSAAASFLYFIVQAQGTSLPWVPRLYSAFLLALVAAVAFLPDPAWNLAVPIAAALVAILPAAMASRRYLMKRSARVRTA